MSNHDKRERTGHKILAILLLVVLFGSSTGVPRGKRVNTKVLILGAGAAGLAAAKTLDDMDIEDFVIVEGSNRIGGRVKSVQFGGETVEAGANWVVGTTGNPLYDIVNSSKFKVTLTDWDSVIIRNSDGVDVTDTEGDAAWSKLEEAQTYIAETVDGLKNGAKDVSLRKCLDNGNWWPTTPVENAVEIFDYDFEYGHMPEVTSCFAAEYNKEFLEDTYYVRDERGYEYLLHEYIEDVLDDNDPRLYLNEVVTEIKHDRQKVRVTTETGDVFTADFVIMTFSIGVLKSGSVTFKPPLPLWKEESLSLVRLENYFGIYLKFPDTSPRFWDDVGFVLYADERRGYFPIWINLEADGLRPSGTNILEVVTFGDDADRVSQLTNSQIITEIMEMLRRVYDDSTIPDPEDIFFNNWRNDPLYRGSFCNMAPGAASPDTFGRIKAPVGRLYFAGEAYDRQLAGYVFGALRSGEHTAKELVKEMESRPEE